MATASFARGIKLRSTNKLNIKAEFFLFNCAGERKRERERDKRVKGECERLNHKAKEGGFFAEFRNVSVPVTR